MVERTREPNRPALEMRKLGNACYWCLTSGRFMTGRQAFKYHCGRQVLRLEMLSLSLFELTDRR